MTRIALFELVATNEICIEAILALASYPSHSHAACCAIAIRDTPQSSDLAMSDPSLTTYLEEREKLVALARSFVRCKHTAEDIVQDSWLRWHGRGYPASDAKSIFRTIVANLSRDWWRRQQTQRAAYDALAMTPDWSPSAEEVSIARSDLLRVITILEKMDPRTRNAFAMSWRDG